MNEVNMPEVNAEMPTRQVSESGGELLRQAREAAGYSVPALASILKVSTAKLDALEASRWDLLPDIVFARALAFSVCRSLHIDAAPVLARFPSLATPNMKTDESGINAPFRVPGEGAGFAWLAKLRQPSSLAVLVLVVSAVLLFMLPRDTLQSSLNSIIGTPNSAASAPNESVPTEIGLNTSNPDVALPEVAGQQPGPDAIVTDKMPVPEAPAKIEASPLPLTVNGTGAVAGTVVLKATGAAWVEVVDGHGTVQVRKTMAEGEVLGASGDSPLSVVIGRADAISVEVRGKSFDLAPLTKNNIARFEVK